MKKVILALSLIGSAAAMADVVIPPPTENTKVLEFKGQEAGDLVSEIGGKWLGWTSLRGRDGGFLSISYKQLRPSSGLFELMCFKRVYSKTPDTATFDCTLRTSLDGKGVQDSTKLPRPVG